MQMGFTASNLDLISINRIFRYVLKYIKGHLVAACVDRAMVTLPHPAPAAIGISPPEDTPYAGLIVLDVDATALGRRIFRVRETVPVARAGNLTLLYPKWLPGYHSPDAPIELFAGLIIRADDQELT